MLKIELKRLTNVQRLDGIYGDITNIPTSLGAPVYRIKQKWNYENDVFHSTVYTSMKAWFKSGPQNFFHLSTFCEFVD